MSKSEFKEKDEDQDFDLAKTDDLEVEEEDEVGQDWSSLAKLVNKTPNTVLPKRGEKEYGPDGTYMQEALLQNRRQAMYNTLENSVRGSTIKNIVYAYYVPERHEAVIFCPRGNFLQTVGKASPDGKCWLSFIEYLYLAERGTIIPLLLMNEELNQEPSVENRVLLSIRELYGFFESKKEMDSFFVYGYLKRLGFVVLPTAQRKEAHGTSFFPSSYPFSQRCSWLLREVMTISKTYIRRIHRFFYYHPAFARYLRLTSYSKIYIALSNLIPFQLIPKSSLDLMLGRYKKCKILNDQVPKLTFDVWKPQASFKKKSPGLPDFQILIFNKNDRNQHFPTFKEMKQIFEEADYKFDFCEESKSYNWDNHSYTDDILRQKYLDSLKRKSKKGNDSIASSIEKIENNVKKIAPAKLLNRKLKNGFCNFLVSVLDDGLISFIKLAETDFGTDTVWYSSPKNGKAFKKKKRV